MKRIDKICKRVRCKHRGKQKLKGDTGFICGLVCSEQVFAATSDPPFGKEDCSSLVKCGKCIAVTDAPMNCPFGAEMAVSQ